MGQLTLFSDEPEPTAKDRATLADEMPGVVSSARDAAAREWELERGLAPNSFIWWDGPDITADQYREIVKANRKAIGMPQVKPKQARRSGKSRDPSIALNAMLEGPKR